MAKGSGRTANITKTVEKLLDTWPFLHDLFRIDAANYSGIARTIADQVEKEVGSPIKLNAIIAAIQRYAQKIKGKPLHNQIFEIITKFRLTLKNDMISITLKRVERSYNLILESYKKINWESGERILIIQSEGEISCLLDKVNADFLLSDGEDELENIEENLSILIVKTPPEMVEVPGVLYYLTGLISRAGITLIDFVTTYREIIFVVHDKDASKTFEILDDIIKTSRRIKND
ncbi:MAG: ACT domain-containing protein [Candidatus Helarchaeota archaeon]|nr:ACT domain-containing protein [Candidatus Helarchaeota archaeon]